jgi:hypothetical protein
MSDEADFAEEAQPPPDLIGELIELLESIKADSTTVSASDVLQKIFALDVLRAIADLKRSSPLNYALLLRELKVFKHEHPQSGFTFEQFNDQIKQLERLDSVLMPDSGPPDIATMLVELSLRDGTLHFLDADTEDAYADIKIDGSTYVATVQVAGRAYERWLSALFYDQTKRAAPRETFKAAIRTIEARTYAARKSFSLFTRIAMVEEAGGPVIYLDIGDETGRAFRIDHAGWTVADQPPVKFIRPEGGVGVLPMPEPGGSIDDLKKMLNLRGDRDFILAIAWVLGCYQPVYALLQALLLGRHGSAKTSAMRRLCALIDPLLNEPSEPVREDRELIIVAQNRYIQAYDNVIKITASRSAALCRMSTGGSQQGRILYTTTGSYSLHARRPVIQTAMRMVVTAPDLIDRTAIIGMGPPFEEANEVNRETERVLDEAFQTAWPKLLGCIFKAVSVGLQHRKAGELVPKPLPRMADFAEWTYRGETGLGWPHGTILKAYRESLDEYARDIAELDTVAASLLQFMLDRPDGWRGPIALLGAHLNRMDGGRAIRGAPRIWDLKELSAAIDELSSVLFRSGLRVARGHSGGRREVILEWLSAAQPNGPEAAPAPEPDETWKPQP